MNITNDKVTEYIDSLYRPLTPELAELREKAESENVPIILKDAETFLLNIIRLKKPKRILEIGAAVGYSSSCFATASECAEIVTVEYNEETYKTAIANIERLGLSDRIKVHLGDGSEVVEKLFVEGCEPFDMVFIDASKSHYKRFWDSALKLCNKDSIIICDNILMRAMTVSDEYDTHGKHKTNIRKMREFVEYINDLEYCYTSVLPIGDGIAISVLNRL
ncbi:MAG: O-methyltransferase [Aminipila sp.]